MTVVSVSVRGLKHLYVGVQTIVRDPKEQHIQADMSVAKPKPLKVYGRNHYACTRCKLSKIKCSGEKPCSNCKNIKKPDDCVYPSRDRKIVIMESDLNKLHDKVRSLEEALGKASNVKPKFSKHEIIQGRLNEENKEFLFNNSGLENFLLPDNANESLKWNLLNFSNNKLPPKEVTLKLIDKVYENYATEFYLIDIKSFLKSVDEIYLFFDSINSNNESLTKFLNDKIKRQTLCYFFIVIAYGEQISNLLSTNDEIPGIQFYLIASELFNLTHEVVTFEFIQGAALLALYSANLNRYNTVYNYFGVAIRAAISQGFHRQPPHVDPNLKDELIKHEKAKRLWWTIFIIDATWTAKMNMPCQIDYTETDVDLPCENFIDLNDSFDINSLEINVHLAKYISKSVDKIYGAHMRGFSVNYINTDKFNQKKLIENVLSCFKNLIRDFEVPFLYQYKSCNIIEPNGRKLVNNFLRFNLLIAIITKPLISLIFKTNETDLFDNPAEIENTFNKAISTSIANINILIKLFEIRRIFIIGFYDSQYLYTAILIIIMTSITDVQCVELVNKAIALLKFMANNGNINAQNCMNKLIQVNEYLSKTPEIDFSLNFNLNIDDVVRVKPVFDINEHYYNPYEDVSYSVLSNFKLFKNSSDMAKRSAAMNRAEKAGAGAGSGAGMKTEIPNGYPNPNTKPGSIPLGMSSPSSINQNPILSQSQTSNFPQSNAAGFDNRADQIIQPDAPSVQPSYPNQYQYPEYFNLKPTVDDFFTNNRIHNLSGSSQNTLLSMMNSLQSWDDYKNFTT